MLSAFKTAIAPGSLQLLAVACLVGLILGVIWPRRRWLTVTWCAVFGGGYLLLGLPVVAIAIARSLPDVPPLATLPAPLRTLVIFDGDNRVGRAREAERVYEYSTPATVWVLGGRWILNRLASDGVPRSRLRLDGETANTRDQVVALRRIVSGGAAGRVCVIASRLQMPRVAALVRAAGLDVSLDSSSIDADPPTSGTGGFLPTYLALRLSRDAIYEHVALTYYRWRGWIGQP